MMRPGAGAANTGTPVQNLRAAPPLNAAAEPCVQMQIFKAELVRIFDKLKGTQDCYVQLLRCHGSGAQKEIARTMTCKGGDRYPEWNESFKVVRGDACALIIRVWAAHFWRQDVVCGEVVMDLNEYDLWNRVLSGELLQIPTGVEITKQKRETGEVSKTGVLFVSMQRYVPGTMNVSMQTAPPAASPEQRVQYFLNKPEEMEERLRGRFQQHARLNRQGVRFLGPEDTEKMAGIIANDLGVSQDLFGDIGQMFWRFETTGEGILYENDSIRLLMYMARQYRDAVCPQKGGSVQLNGIEYVKNLEEKYAVGKELGRGGQGVVYLATDRSNSNQVVLKLYEKTNQNVDQESITQEFELLMELKHPKIARVFDIFQDWENVYIVQEPYFGGDLTSAVANASQAQVRVDERWLAYVMQQVVQGVAFLHNNGVVHSDLKEANVMVAGKDQWARPQVIVIDFGLANKFNAKSGVGGTPGYMPPEVWINGLWTPRGDVFSIGAMLFTLRNGKHPFYPPGSPSIEEIANVTRNQPTPQSMGSPQIQQLINGMLSKNFLQRPTCGRLMQVPWFHQGEDSQIDTQTLGNLMVRHQQTELYRALLTEVASRENLAQLRELNDLFMSLDSDNDGKISKAEVQEALNGRWPKQDIDRLVASLIPHGTNAQDDQLSYDAFMGRLIASQAADEERMLRRIFDEVANPRKGVLGKQEVLELAKLPAVKRLLGDKPPEDLMKSLDENKDGKVTFQEFARVVGAGKFADDHSKATATFAGGKRTRTVPPEWRVGQEVDFWSSSYSTWVKCRITAVDRNAVQVDQKPNYWFQGEELAKRIRLPGDSVGFHKGQEVSLWSTRFHTWIPTRITEVDPTGAVMVDQKPGYWFRGHELQTRLRDASTHAHSSHEAKTAGLGRALFEGALAGLHGDQGVSAGRPSSPTLGRNVSALSGVSTGGSSGCKATIQTAGWTPQWRQYR